MKAARLSLSLAAAATVVSAAALIAPAHAATGDTWSGFKVVDVKPAATTQTAVLGLMPHYKQGNTDLYLWNIVRMVTDKDGNEAWVFCIQQQQGGDAPFYTEDPIKGGTTLGRANAGQINRVLASSTLPDPGSLEVTAPDANKVDPATDVLPRHKSDHIEVTAVQLALWHFTEGQNFTSANTTISKDFYPASYSGDADDVTMADVLARYDALVAQADANPLTNPAPSITITPTSTSVGAGTAVTYTVKGKDIEGGITLDADDATAKVYAAKAGGTCDTSSVITALPSAGGTFCVVSDTATTVKVTASGKSSKATSHPLYAQNAQTLIAIAPEKAKASVSVQWIGSKPSSSATSSSTSTPCSSMTPSGSASTSGSPSSSASTSGSPSTSPSGSSSPSGSASGSASSSGNASPSSSASPCETSSSSPSATSSTSSVANATSSSASSGVEETDSSGNATVENSSAAGALAGTGPLGLVVRAMWAVMAVVGGALLVIATRRRRDLAARS